MTSMARGTVAWRRRWLLRVVAGVISVKVTLLVAELMFRWLAPRGISYQVAASQYLLSLASDIIAHPLVYR